MEYYNSIYGEESDEEAKKQLDAQLGLQVKKQIKMREQIAIIENKAKTFLDKDAIMRYGNLKLAHSEKALQAALLILKLAEAGQIKGRINDAEFKQLLIEIDSIKKTGLI